MQRDLGVRWSRRTVNRFEAKKCACGSPVYLGGVRCQSCDEEMDKKFKEEIDKWGEWVFIDRGVIEVVDRYRNEWSEKYKSDLSLREAIHLILANARLRT